MEVVEAGCRVAAIACTAEHCVLIDPVVERYGDAAEVFVEREDVAAVVDKYVVAARSIWAIRYVHDVCVAVAFLADLASDHFARARGVHALTEAELDVERPVR